MSDDIGNIQFDVKKTTFAEYPTFSSITNFNYPGLSSQSKNYNTIPGWDIINEDDILEFSVINDSTIKKLSLIVKLQQYP